MKGGVGKRSNPSPLQGGAHQLRGFESHRRLPSYITASGRIQPYGKIRGTVPNRLGKQYRTLKKIASQGVGGEAVSGLVSRMALYARLLLQRTERVQLTSRVLGKSYFGFRGRAHSRPINEGLYVLDGPELDRLLSAFQVGFRDSEPDEIIRSTYTIAYSILAANDAYEIGRKASATFFEILIGHIVSRRLGISPRKRVVIPESGADLPTDFVFDPGSNSSKIHLPIKTSTRERGVQAWVHQLVLDRIFGTGQYLGILVVSSETKRDSRTGEVIEICVPGQFQMFQTRVAEMTRVYYLDPPQAYLDLSNRRPRVEVRSFGNALGELPELLRT